MIVARVARWLDDRLGTSHFARTTLNKVFPDHWSFMVGEIALYAFVILVLTGLYLTMFFEPSSTQVVYEGSYEPLRGAEVSAAYRSVLELSFDVRAGLVFRQMHHWTALVFVGAIVLHLLRVFFTGAFRRPRELNWIVGVTMLVIALFAGFTGYSLPDDLLAGTGLRIGYSIALSIPVVGVWLTFLFFGGEFPAEDVLSRLFVFHTMILPGSIIALLTAHMAILWRQKHTQFAREGRSERNVVGDILWPTYAVKSIALFFGLTAVLAALGGLAQINPIWLWGPFDPALETAPAQPDWYWLWMDGALRLFPPWEIRAFGYTIPNPFFPAVLFPALTFLVMYAWPWLERWATKDRAEHHLLDRPSDHPVRTALGAGVVAFYSILLVAGSNDVIARLLGVPVLTVTWTLRVVLFVIPPIVGAVVIRSAHARQRARAEAEHEPVRVKEPER